MSKHIFEETLNGQKYEIQLGWDNPLQRYYGVIIGWVLDTDADDGGYFDDLVWSNIYQTPHLCSLQQIATEITKRGFTIPEGLLDNVYHDKTHNISNQRRFYETNAQQRPITEPIPTID